MYDIEPEWIKLARAYPDTGVPRDIREDQISYDNYRIPRAIGDAYTSPYPYAAVFEIYCPKPHGPGESPQIPCIRLVCLGAEYNEWSDDWKPVIVIPTGWLL